MDPGLHSVEQLPLARTAFVKRRSAGGVSHDDALHDGAVEVPMRIEQRDDHRLEDHARPSAIGNGVTMRPSRMSIT